MHGRPHIALTIFLVSAYLSTWSAALVHTIAFPALGTGPAKVTACGKPSKDAPRVVFAQRRHMPAVKGLSVATPPSTRVDPPSLRDRGTGLRVHVVHTLLPSPDRSAHAGRAPPDR